MNSGLPRHGHVGVENQNAAIKLQCGQKCPIKKLIHVIANDEIFHLLALSDIVVKCHPHRFNSVDVAPTIQPHSSGLPEISEGRFPM